MRASRRTVRDGGRQPQQRNPGRQVVAVDFETYYDADYTLRKLSTSEYIRDPRFKVLSAAIKVGDGPVKFHGGEKAVRKALAAIKWSESSLLCHHTHFDGLILTHHFGHKPAFYLDTLSMGRGLHAKFERNDLGTLAARYGVTNKREMPDVKGRHWEALTPEEQKALELYNVDDVVGMVEVFEKMVSAVPDKEMRLIDLTVRMFVEPTLRLNERLAKQELKREVAERKLAIKGSNALAIAKEFGIEVKPKKKGEKVADEQVLASNVTFPKLLRALGVEPPMKVSKYNGKDTYALSKADEEFTDLLVYPDAKVVALVRGRLAAKSTIGETRAARLLESGHDGKALPVYLNYCGAHTMRWSGGDKLNYQNFKKKGELRQAVMAPPGYQIVDIDSSTIEVRVLAWLAGEEWLLDAFRRGEDPYIIFGSEVYGFDIGPLGKKSLERFVAKTCVLGLGFQMGGPKLQTSMLAQSINQGLDPVRLELPVCYGLVNKYRNKNRKIEDLWGFMQDTVLPALIHGDKVQTYKCLEFGREFIRLKGGLALHYPEASARHVKKMAASGWSRTAQPTEKIEDASYRTPMGRSKLYGGLLTENVVQYLARHVVAEQMLKIAERYQVVMMTHDAVGFLAPTKEAPAALAWGLEIMKTPPVWAPDLPVSAEGHFAPVYK